MGQMLKNSTTELEARDTIKRYIKLLNDALDSGRLSRFSVHAEPNLVREMSTGVAYITSTRYLVDFEIN